MWIEQRGRQHRVYYRSGLARPKKAFEPFATRDQAEAFVEIARRSSLSGAVVYVRDPNPSALRELLGLPRLAHALESVRCERRAGLHLGLLRYPVVRVSGREAACRCGPRR